MRIFAPTRSLTLIASLALLGCTAAPTDDGAAGDSSDGGDSDPLLGDSALPGDAEPRWLDLAVGEVGEMNSDDEGVWAEVVTPGSYVLILVSTAEDQGTLFGYGPGVAKGKRSTPSDPPPDGKWPPPTPDRKTEVGDQRIFQVFNGTFTSPIFADAIEVTDRIVLWEDTTTANPLGSIDMVMIDQVLIDLEAIVLPREEHIFGALSDVDADGQIAVLLSYAVNQYGAKAFVTWCDIGVTQGCGPNNNDAEVVYLGIPDPAISSSTVNGIVETVAHELNHLIYGHHKFVLNGLAAVEENIYITEGFSALAQDLTGYNNGNQYVWAAAIDMASFYGDDINYTTHALSINDLLRGDSYYDLDRDGALRGGAYLFMRYLFEQQGGMRVAVTNGAQIDDGGMAWLQSYFTAPELGVEAVEVTTGADLWDLTMDWYTALVVTGRRPVDAPMTAPRLNDDPIFNYEDRLEDPLTGYSYGVDPFATIHGWLNLTGPPIQTWDSPDGDLRAGGVEYILVDAPVGRLSLDVDSAALARARLFRVD